MYNEAHSSAVYVDRLKESKKLADNNAQLRIENEQLEKQHKGLLERREDIIRKSGYTPAEYAKVEKEHFSRVKDIENKIVEGRIELGKIEKTTQDKLASLKNISVQTQDLEPKLKTLKSDIEILTTRKENANNSAIEAETKYNNLIEEKSKELSTLTDKADKTKNANLVMTQEMEKRIASVVEQERQLSIRRTDMEIYEARLRQKYPNDPIILQ